MGTHRSPAVDRETLADQSRQQQQRLLQPLWCMVALMLLIVLIPEQVDLLMQVRAYQTLCEITVKWLPIFIIMC